MGLGEKEVSNARKRKISGEADDGRAIKHRASKACQSCRTRKVRCDVLINASRCSNCRLDELECITIASRRGQNKRRKAVHPPSPRSDNGDHIEHTTSTARATVKDSWNVPGSSVGSVPICVSFDDEPGNDKNDEDDGGDSNATDHQLHIGEDAATDLSPSTTYASLLTPDSRPVGNLQPQHSQRISTLPAFITPLSRHISGEDLEYLERKGAFTIPEPDLQIEILRAYLFSVQPFMPILDHRALVRAVITNRQDNRVSLLLFQAVMFAGLHSLQLPVIHRLGFESAKEARSTFFNRVRLLYEFDVEPDIVAVFQSLVLMSSWYSKWDSRRDTWHWTGLAYDVARRMGLHREPTAKFASEKARRFRKRLWWSFYIRDRMIALGTRRPMRIYDADCDVSMLTLEDFDLEPFDECYQGQPLMPGAKESEATALMCIHLAKLCICVGHVVSSQYSTLSTQQDQDIPHSVMIVSRRDEGRIEQLESCDQELSRWFEEFNSTVNPTIFPRPPHAGPHSCSEVHWAVLNMTYQTTVNVLHRTSALQPSSSDSDNLTEQNASRSKVKRSARELTKLSMAMLRQDQLRFLGLIGVTAIIATYLSHVLDITSATDEDEDARDASTFRLYQSLEVLQSFRGIYASADAAVSFLASVSQKVGISVPIQADGNSTGMRPQNQGHGLQIQQGHANQTIKQAGPYSGDELSMSNRPRQQSTLDTFEHTMPMNSLMTQSKSSALAVLPSANHTQLLNPTTAVTSSIQHSVAPFTDTRLDGSSSYHGNTVSLFDWDNTMSSNIDLDSMSFDHDFYIDTFGFTDAHLHGL
ncbi:hypothetical protein M409DRAFT_25268 [Zasmidium cellare ATCC 36951]|uniref:Zn(2)-C6 fungal-type domain-containing protein n=1 Tax=Zasmidium cellare ATCC 36951 TaxID=1080233 RepID=A0A6A6CDT7_ZASCE|nr:uncharacterized protein M409DRAFT_25268 [Zasmidium cellare ATCC 36951]KAF2164390.1 hypothetical protein M409DRAFT_25268 [Zasmidium cellare ATCC 36951]